MGVKSTTTTFTVMRGTYHAIARCQNCDWKRELYTVAEKEAIAHCIETGHHVDLETGETISRTTVEEMLGE